MNNIQKRFLLFIFGCIPTRLLFAYLAYNTYNFVLKILGIIALIISFGFFYLYFTGKRKTGPEVFGGVIWWNNLRPIHGLLYLFFAISVLIYNNKNAYKIIVIDAIIGLISFLWFHYTNGDMNKLI